jgi:hypothetical protein
MRWPAAAATIPSLSANRRPIDAFDKAPAHCGVRQIGLTGGALGVKESWPAGTNGVSAGDT